MTAVITSQYYWAWGNIRNDPERRDLLVLHLLIKRPWAHRFGVSIIGPPTLKERFPFLPAVWVLGECQPECFTLGPQRPVQRWADDRSWANPSPSTNFSNKDLTKMLSCVSDVQWQYKSGTACGHKTERLRWEKDRIIWFLDIVFPEPTPTPLCPGIGSWINKYSSIA